MGRHGRQDETGLYGLREGPQGEAVLLKDRRWSMIDDRSGLSGSLACLCSLRSEDLKSDANGTAGDVVYTQIERHTVCDPAGDDCRTGEIHYPWRVRKNPF